MVGLAAVGVLVGAEPERLDARHSDLGRAADVLVEAVADEERISGRDLERLESALEDLGVRLALADLGREDRVVDPLGDSHLLEVTVKQPAGVERVRDEPEPQPARAQRLEQRVSRRRRAPAPAPRQHAPPRGTARAPPR